MQLNKMSSVFLACLLVTLMTGAQAKEKQIKLEDIERDNLAAERYAKTAKQQHQQQQHQPTPQNHQNYQALQRYNQQLNYPGPEQSSLPAGNYYLPNLIKTQSYQTHPIQTGHHQQYQHHQHQPQQQQRPVTTPIMQYGFRPLKSNYQVYQQPQHGSGAVAPVQHQSQQVQYQYTPNHSHTEAYLPPLPSLAGTTTGSNKYAVNSGLQAPRVQYAVHQQEDTPPPRPQSHEKYAIPIQTQAYQQYIQNQAANAAHAGHTQIQYVPESQLQYYQYQNSQQHQNPPQPQQIQAQGQVHQHQPTQPTQHQAPQIQYVVDNSIQTDPQTVPQDDQKYYQQVVYLQPYQTPSASNNIHSIADTKGNVQYVMYIPAGAAAPYPGETVLAYPTNQETQYVYQPVLDDSQQVTDNPNLKSSVAQPSAHSQFDIETPKTPKRIERPLFKHQPTSLLDSYVPSYLQYEYYKQQQAEANAIKQSLKVATSDIGKTDVVKTYTSNKGETSAY